MFRWIQTLLLSKKKFLCLHILCHSISRDLVDKKRKSSSSNKKNAKKSCWDVKRNKFFYRVSIWWMNVYTRVMLNVYFCVDNCCIFCYFHISIKNSQKICNWKLKKSHINWDYIIPLVDIRNPIELTAHTLNPQIVHIQIQATKGIVQLCIITFDIWKRCRGIEIEELEWHNVTFKWIHMAIYPFTDITHFMTFLLLLLFLLLDVFKKAILLSHARRTWNSKTFIFVSFKLRIEIYLFFFYLEILWINFHFYAASLMFVMSSMLCCVFVCVKIILIPLMLHLIT